MAYVITDSCVNCGTCEIDASSCVDCGTCAGACPTGAIESE